MQEIFKRLGERGLKLWQLVLLITLSLFAVGVGILLASSNPLLFPTIALLGSFAVPVTYVTFFYENRQQSLLGVTDIVLSFLYGGVLGVFLATIFLPVLIPELSLLTLFGAAGIEEIAKILAVGLIVRGLSHSSELNGVLVGAAVGMGFAALESIGYSFLSFLESEGNFSSSILLTLLRALVSPVGHGTWTAIFAGILFLESTPFDFQLTARVFGAFLLVTVLHGLWNGIPFLLPTSLFGIILAELAIAGIGFFVLYQVWQDAKRRQKPFDQL
ncbi:MAG TPA: PrsW family glutamic-type intramembrane protease [Clostridia bacterium]|nr:PrsW family glutamic-type intramembrane protease [Clostridia bacterium]